MAIKKFTLRNMFTEDDGKPSFSRVSCAVVLVVMLGLIVFVTLKNGQLPELGATAVLVPSCVTALYGFNKVATAIAGK